MYYLDYRYLHELDIDTSNSARDISATAIFAAIADNDYYVPLSAVSTRFIEWFFVDSTNPNIKQLDITLKHAYLTGRALTANSPGSLLPLSTVTAAISAQLSDIKDKMLSALNATISALSAEAVIPVGSVAINKSAPTVSGTWVSATNRFIGELGPNVPSVNITAASVHIPLSSLTVSSNTMPQHRHEVTLDPKTFNKTGSVEGSLSNLGSYIHHRHGAASKNKELSETTITATRAHDGYDGDSSAMGAKAESIAKGYQQLFKVADAGSSGSGTTKKQHLAPPVTELPNTAIFVKTS